jgi:beta-glucosidase
VTNLVTSLSTTDKIAMLSGGQEQSAASGDKWKIDFNATGAPSIGLKDMPMRDGPRGVHQLNDAQSTTWAVAAARGASFDVALESAVGAAQGAEMKAFKYDVALAPTMNVLRHPGWGRAQETYGEDPVLVGNMAAAFVHGMQDGGMMACPKHFAVNNTENNRGDGVGEPVVNMVVDAQTLHENYLRNFQIVVEKSDPACIMAAYNRVNGSRCTQNAALITDVARKEWKTENGGPWTGMMISDWWATVPNQGAATINAGLDLEMPDNQAFKTLPTDVMQGTVTATRLNEAASRIINARIKFKHNTDAYKNSPLNTAIVNDPSQKALARRTAEEGAVLLKNDGLMPLVAKTPVKSIVFLGPDAAVPTTNVNTAGVASGLGDRGSSNTIPPYAVSFMAGVQMHASAAGLAVKSSANADDASTADVAIIPVTMAWEDEGEGYDVGQDRQDLTLSGAHPKHWTGAKPAAFIQQAAAKNPNVIVVLAVGSAIVMEDWIGSAKSIVQTFYPGQEGGNAFADLLFGTKNFSGKLPFTVATNPADYPAFQNTTGGDATVDYYHGYRKFQHDAKMPRFWFGFGLSYTTYTYGELKVLCPDGVANNAQLNVEIPVTNSGTVAGTEVVELYIQAPNMVNPSRPRMRELKAFARVDLDPGAMKTVQLSVPVRDMSYWDSTKNGWAVEQGTYTVYVGPSADETTLKHATFTVN